jgi:two-component system, response regulator, stage 0 sporulation protein F
MTSKTSILYVDDEPINLMLFETCFNEMYTIFSADSGAKGLDILRANKNISFVFSDMKMPGMNGVEFIQKASLEFPDSKYYILTGFSLTDVISNAIESGLVKKCFFKPFDIEEIENEIELNK